MSLPLLTRALAEAKLADHIALIGECLRAGADRYNESRQHFGVLSSRSQASVIHDYAAEYAEMVFADVAGVTPRRCKGELLVLDVEGEILIRFHKLAEGWQYSRNDTLQSKQWERQEPLDGMPASHFLSAAYRLDEKGREMETVALVYKLYGRYQWHIDIPAPGSVVDLPQTFDDTLDAPEIQSDIDIAADDEAADDDAAEGHDV